MLTMLCLIVGGISNFDKIGGGGQYKITGSYFDRILSHCQIEGK